MSMVKSKPAAMVARRGEVTSHHQYRPFQVMTPPEIEAPPTVIIMNGRMSIPDFVAE